MTRSISAGLLLVLVLGAARTAHDDQPESLALQLHQNAPGPLSPGEVAAGWRSLFHGKTTGSWRGYKQKGFPAQGWAIDEGNLHVKAGGGGGDIITKGQFGDFELILEWRVAAKANSGIMYRVTEAHKSAWQTGPEYQILDDGGHGLEPTNAHSAGALYDLRAPAAAKKALPAGEWNKTRVRLHDNHLEHWLNGVKVVSIEMQGETWAATIAKSKFKGYKGFGIQPRGHIALQDHGNDVWFRNIKIRDLDAPMPGEVALWNGRDFTGLSAHLRDNGRMADVWNVSDGVLICKGKPAGYIYTDAAYESFVLKLEWRFDPVTKKAGNSGVLLRRIGPHKVWPKSVEAQLQSGSAGDFWNIEKFGMKTVPERTRGRNTRKTHGAEKPLGQWNEYEIIVDGSDIVLKVNGQVLNHAWDVTVIPGQICLQSEGAVIHFRRIRLAPIPSNK